MNSSNNSCKKCGKPKDSESSGRLTQFINLCNCDVSNQGDQLLDSEASYCENCGKKVNQRPMGSFTQFIFQSHFCVCDKPKADRDFAHVPLTGPAFEGAEPEDEGEIELDSSSFPIERYKPLQVLGRGGTGQVYLARDRLLKKKVSVKILQVLEREFLLAFQEEARAISRLDDPNIISIIDFGITESSVPYMVLEHFESITLASYMEQIGICSLEECWIIFSQVCGALSTAHDNGVFHRDLKPDNILVAGSVADDIVVKVIDFGVAKIAGATAGDINKQTHTIAGTPSYMPPDQVAGYDYDVRSEVYSVGCVLFEALSGSPPYRADTSLEILSMHAHSAIPQLNDRQNRVVYPPAVQDIIDSCLAKDPSQRYQSMNDLLQAIEGLFTSKEEPSMILTFNKRLASKPDTKFFVFCLLILAVFVVPVLLSARLFVSDNELKEKTNSRYASPRHPYGAEQRKEDRVDLPGEDLLEPRLLPVGRMPHRYFASGDWSDQDLMMIKDYKKIRGLTLTGKQITGSGLQYLKGIPLRGLDLSKTAVEDRYLYNLVEIRSLNNLNLNLTRVSDSGLKCISELPRLKYLGLRGTRVTDKVCFSLSRSGNLSILDLRELKNFQGESLSELTTLKSFIWLILNDTKLSEKGFEELGQLTNLKNLSIQRCGLTDACLVKLVNMRLDTVDLSGNQITDSGLMRLSSIKTLKKVIVADIPSISPKAKETLRKAIPHCRVELHMDPKLKLLYEY